MEVVEAEAGEAAAAADGDDAVAPAAEAQPTGQAANGVAAAPPLAPKHLPASQGGGALGKRKRGPAPRQLLVRRGCDVAALSYCERFVELLIDLLTQLPTRRFVAAVLEDRQVR